jgi:DNA-binding transcriptional LysR family regulator
MDELSRVTTFIKVVEQGTFSAAARDVSSVSSVARQVKSLEDELGIRLLNRTTRSLALTEAGQLFYVRAKAIAQDLANAMSEAQSFQEEAKGVLRVSARISTGTTIIVPALPGFLKKHPELTVEFTLSDERHDLVSNNIDVGIWAGYMPDTELVARPLRKSKRIVCASPLYFDKNGLPERPDQLVEHNCLRFTGRAYGHKWRFSRGEYDKEVEVKGDLCSDNGLVLVAAAMADMGLIVVQEWMVHNLLLQGRLIRILSDYAVDPRPGDADLFDLYAVYTSNRGLSKKVRVFIDFLVELFRLP